MRKLFALLLFLPFVGFTQQQTVYCNTTVIPNIPCSSTTQVGNGFQGESAGKAFGKMNANFNTVMVPYAQTAAESSAGITPVNYGYAPGNVLRYGGDATGANDSTTALQNCINTNNRCYVPSGTFKFSAIVMPSAKLGFVLGGDGSSSVLQQTGTGISWPSTGTGTAAYNEHYIRDLSFIGTSGTGHTIDATYAGGPTLLNLYFTDNPPNFASIRVAGNTASTGDKYTHDVRLSNIQIYSHTTSGEGIFFDSTTSDTLLERFIMNGNSLVPYNILMANGAQSVNIANSHPYNAATNILLLQAGATTALGMTFTNNIFDNVSTGSGDNVVLNNASTPVFTGNWFQVIHSGHSGLTLNNVRGTSLSNNRFDGVAGANYVINETGTTDYTVLLGGDCPSIANFLNPAANFIGAHSYAKGFIAINVFAAQVFFTGATTAVIPTNTTTMLGVNGAQALANNTAFMVAPVSGLSITEADLAWTVAPGAAQTYTISLICNGVTMTAAAGSANPLIATGTGSFGGTIKIAPGAAQFCAQFNQVWLQWVSSNGAGAPNVRYAINGTG